MKPLVSVVLPAFNAEPFIAAAIESVLGQAYAPIELVVVDDGSTDGTATIAGRFDIRYLYQENAGPSAARNNGVAAANGEYLAFIDQDDLWRPGKIGAQVEALEADRTAGIAVCRIDFLFEGGEAPPWFDQERTPAGGAGYVPSCWLVRSDVFEKVGPFRQDLIYAQDVDWLARASDSGFKPLVVDEVLVDKRVHDGNLSRPSAAAQKDLVDAVRLALRRKAPGRE